MKYGTKPYSVLPVSRTKDAPPVYCAATTLQASITDPLTPICNLTSIQNKLKRLNYKTDYAYRMVNYVREKDEHTALHGKKGELLNYVREILIFNITESVFLKHERPSQSRSRTYSSRLNEGKGDWRTIWHIGVHWNHRSATRLNNTRKNEKVEEYLAKRDEKEVRETILVQHGNSIRDLTIRRMSGGIYD